MRVVAVLLGAQMPPMSTQPPMRWLTDLVWIANHFVASGAVREPAVAATSLAVKSSVKAWLKHDTSYRQTQRKHSRWIHNGT